METSGPPSPAAAAVTNGDEQMNDLSPPAAGDMELPADGDPDQEHQPQASPAKGKGRAKGRGNAKGKAKGAKTAQQKPAQKPGASGRGRRQKVYDSLKVQAAYERMQELKANFTTVAKLLKPSLQELADRTISKLTREEKNLPDVAETEEVQNFLDQRLTETQAAADAERHLGLDMASHVYRGNVESVIAGSTTQAAELCYERYGHLLRQLAILEFLHENNLPVNFAPAEDKDYINKDISQEAADHPGPYEVIRDGIHIPFPGTPITELLKCKPFEEDTERRPKRKAQEQPEGQPAVKIGATSKDDDSDMPDVPARHIGGLLSAVEEFGAGVDSPSASNAPSPAAVPDDTPDVPSPRNSQRRAAATRPAKSRSKTPQQPEEEGDQEPPLPKGVSEPDQFGVRITTRKANRSEGVNNRILYPALFDFEDYEIGFRDSTNSPTVGATKARRGKYLNTPNSSLWAADRRIGIWDATKTTEDDFDPVLVEKHKVHPKMGLFLKDSVNESEPPRPHVSGWKPVKFTAPDGTVRHASRTIPRDRDEKRAQATERRILLAESLKAFCRTEEIDLEEIQVDEVARQEERRKKLETFGLDPDEFDRQLAQGHQKKPAQASVETPPTPPTPPPPSIRESLRSAGKRRAEAAAKSAAAAMQQHVANLEPDTHASSTTEADVAIFGQNLEQLLQAAAVSDSDEDAAQASSHNKTRQPSQISRPYDVIRDVFLESSPREAAATTVHEPAFVDTTALDALAGIAIDQDQHAISMLPPGAPLAPPQFEGMVDPRLFGASHPHPTAGIAPPAVYNPADGYNPTAEYARSDLAPPDWSNERQRGPESPARSNDFLRTALNPPGAFPPLAPAPPQGSIPGAPPLAAPAGRTPFTNPGMAPGALPALRPMRNILNDSPPPLPIENPGRAPVNSNTGAYYGPVHARSYHTSYTMEDPGTPQIMQQSPLAMPMQAPPSVPQLGQQPPGFGSFQSQMSPPSYPMAAPPLTPAPAPGPGPAPGPSPPVVPMIQPLPQGIAPPPVLAPQPTAGPQPSGGQRSRPSSSSSSAAQAAKYRKLEPAPTPPHRQGYSGGGNSGTELRTVQFDYREQIKDYTPVEAPPRTGPTQIRGWTHNNIKKWARQAGNAPPAHPHSSYLANNTSHTKGDNTTTDDPS